MEHMGRFRGIEPQSWPFMKKISFQSMGSGFRAYGIPHFQVPNPFWNWMSETKKHGCDH